MLLAKVDVLLCEIVDGRMNKEERDEYKCCVICWQRIVLNLDVLS